MTFEARFSDATDRMRASSTDLWRVHNLAQKRLAEGEDIILMSVGDPDLPTLERIIEHAVTSLYRGRTHYSPGMGEVELRETIAEIETRVSGKPTSIDEIIIFPGATNAVYSTLSCLLNETDELVVVDPGYIGYEGIYQLIGATVNRVASDPATGFSIETDVIEAALTSKTRVLLLNTPGNPAGNVIDASQLKELAGICLERNIWLVCDEVYSMITFGKAHVSARTAAQALDNVIVVDGLSKSHAMTGWRLGWAVAPTNVIARLLDFTSATVFGCSQFVQDAAAFALKNDADYIRGVVEEYRQRRDYACSRIDQIAGISAHKPEAGMFLMTDVARVSDDGYSFASELLESQGVSVLPGGGFGEVTRSFVRMSLTHPVPVLEEAFDRIERFVARA